MKQLLTLLLLFQYYFTIAQTPSLTKGQKVHKTAGDILVTALPTVALTSTFEWKDGQNGTLQFSKAFISTVAVTGLLKYIIKKERPNGESFNSFPSGHTSISFSGAGFLQKRYGWGAGIPAYLIASYVGFSRIKAKKHDKWDVLAGAVIGIGFSYLFTKPYQPEKNVNPINNINNQPLIGFTYNF